MIRILPSLLCCILVLSLFACGQENATPPDDADVEQALRRHYEQVEEKTPDIKIRQGERKRIPLEDESRDDPETSGAKGHAGPGFTLEIDKILAQKDCRDVRIIIDRNAGEEGREIFRFSCDVLDEAKTSMRESIRNLGKMAESFTHIIESEFSRITGLDHASVLACVPARSKPGFVCDVEAALSYSDDQVRRRLVTARFVKGRDGWVALDVEESMR